MSTGWTLDRVTHTFATGRQAVLRPSPNLVVAYTNASPEDLASGRVTEAMLAIDRMHAILQAMFVDPVILDFGEQTVDEHNISWEELRPEEIAEVITLWRESAAKADGFRKKPARARARKNGAGVAVAAERDAGPSTG